MSRLSTLPDTTIINCFKKAGISTRSQLSSPQETDNTFAELTQVLEKLRALDPDLAPDVLTAEIFIARDEEVATSILSLQSDEELLYQFNIENMSEGYVEVIDDESTDGINKENGINRKKSAKQESLIGGNRLD